MYRQLSLDAQPKTPSPADKTIKLKVASLSRVIVLKYTIIYQNTKVILMSEKKVKFEFEKQNKNSIRYKEVPEDGMPPVIGSIYVQKWFAGDSKNIEITISKTD